jgi:hypothetical protein
VPKHKKRRWIKPNEEREVFDLLASKKEVPTIVRETGIGRSKVYELRNKFLRVAEPLDPIQQQATIRKIETHWGEALAILKDLQGTGVFGLGARAIRIWISRPHEPSWPAPNGMVHRNPDGSISFRPFHEDKPVWEDLKRHLTGHPLLDAIEGWGPATAKDVTGRRSLFEWLLGQVEAELELPVLLDDASNNIGEPYLTCFYVDHLYEKLFRRVSGLPAYEIDTDGLRITSELNVNLYNETLVVGCNKGQRDRAIHFLREGSGKLSETPVAKAAGEAYRHADDTTQELKIALARFLQLAGPTPETRCEECKSWFEKLGVINEVPSQ